MKLAPRTTCPRARTLALLIAAGVCSFGGRASASDTLETWDVGATDVDFYLGLDGIRSDSSAAYGDIMLGYGIRPRLSAYLGTRLQGERATGAGETTIYLGVFGTVLDTRYVDFDVVLNVANGGPGMARFELSPAFELNLDAAPDMSRWGAYLRSALPVHSERTDGPAIRNDSHTDVHVSCTLGLYWTVATGRQVLAEYSFDYHPSAVTGRARRFEIGGVAVGYNHTLSGGLEIVSEVFFDIPQGGERAAFGLLTGFIATLPAGPG